MTSDKPLHPMAFSHTKSGANSGSAFELNAGDRFIYEIDGRHGRADEFLQDGDAYVLFDDGTYDCIKWNHMRPENMK